VRGLEKVRRFLPHRYPFLMVDRIEEIGDDRVVGLKNVSIDEPFFQGHFPEPLEAVMPGVLILEAMAQTSAFLLANPKDTEDADRPTGYLVGVDNARFRRKVVPGDQLRIEARLVRRRGKLLRVEACATVDTEEAASATLSIVIA
jgi:3-hydroxyacyl-[acyl-carrier-protein] dehydratase